MITCIKIQFLLRRDAISVAGDNDVAHPGAASEHRLTRAEMASLLLLAAAHRQVAQQQRRATSMQVAHNTETPTASSPAATSAEGTSGSTSRLVAAADSTRAGAGDANTAGASLEPLVRHLPNRRFVAINNDGSTVTPATRSTEDRFCSICDVPFLDGDQVNVTICRHGALCSFFSPQLLSSITLSS